jgi:hypothetical protein
MTEVRAKAGSRRGESLLAERFALFAECLLTGVWIAVASLPLVTYPAAFAAGARHLGRRVRHQGGGCREFAADFRSAVRGGWLVGLAGWAALAAVWTNVQAVRAGLPGGPAAGAVAVSALIGAAARSTARRRSGSPAAPGGRCSRPPAGAPCSTPPVPS